MIQLINTVSAVLTSNLMRIIIIVIKHLCLIYIINSHEEIRSIQTVVARTFNPNTREAGVGRSL